MKKKVLTLFAALMCVTSVWAQESGYEYLDAMVPVWKRAQQTTFGYPASQESLLEKFYQLYIDSGMDVVNLNNAGDPMTDAHNSQQAELAKNNYNLKHKKL